MSLATQLGKDWALAQLRARRRSQPVLENNPTQPFFAQKSFVCISCGAEISAPGGFQNLFAFPVMPTLCRECWALKELGWLNE
jgi:hypothetical protein